MVRSIFTEYTELLVGSTGSQTYYIIGIIGTIVQETIVEGTVVQGTLHTGYNSPEAEFLDEIQTKVLRDFLLAIHNHLFAFRFIFLQIHATSYNFFSSVTDTVKEKEENLTIPSSLWFKRSIQKFAFWKLFSTRNNIFTGNYSAGNYSKGNKRTVKLSSH
jgi:hypothetical protein